MDGPIHRGNTICLFLHSLNGGSIKINSGGGGGGGGGDGGGGGGGT